MVVPWSGSCTPSITDVQYNRPRFLACAEWETNATTFADNTSLGISSGPFGLFIDTSDMVYAVNRQISAVQIWPQGSNNYTRTLTGSPDHRRGILVMMNGDVFVDNTVRGQVDKWLNNDAKSSVAMGSNTSCYSLFIDIKNALYCAMGDVH